ncbi:MAG: hypothetical protein EPO41_06030 [Reyranella sp.]|uniref:hypothetical protein n=1 Tax=Reyranella sp. TaxID=1929291 RepID=UPI0011FE2B9F|nr:hypothetical protein [Reyranella sp.]TAJ96590.1 MAG: hypothetical protein EPO41_06030 [Reyranella sp.]
MRHFPSLPILMAIVSWPGSLVALDCAALTNTEIPFALASEVTTRRTGEAPTTRLQQMQVFRKGGEVTTYTVDSPAIYLRTRGASSLFPVDAYYSTEPDDPRRWTYSIGPTVQFARGQPVRYSADMKHADGKLQLAARVTLELLESGILELSGCPIKVLKYRRTLDGLADRHPVSNSEELTFAPALRATLGSVLRTGDIEVVSTPAAISLDFKYIE